MAWSHTMLACCNLRCIRNILKAYTDRQQTVRKMAVVRRFHSTSAAQAPSLVHILSVLSTFCCTLSLMSASKGFNLVAHLVLRYSQHSLTHTCTLFTDGIADSC